MRGFSPDTLRALGAYEFPGNVRELENIVERAVALCVGSVLALGDLPREVSGASGETAAHLVDLPEGGVSLDAVLAEVERRLILQAVERADGVRTNAAKLLGITFRSLRYRMQKLALSEEDDDGPPSTTDLSAPSSD